LEGKRKKEVYYFSRPEGKLATEERGRRKDEGREIVRGSRGKKGGKKKKGTKVSSINGGGGAASSSSSPKWQGEKEKKKKRGKIYIYTDYSSKEKRPKILSRKKKGERTEDLRLSFAGKEKKNLRQKEKSGADLLVVCLDFKFPPGKKEKKR